MISELDFRDWCLTVRAHNALINGKIRTPHQLSETTMRELLLIDNCGKKTVDEIVKAASDHGIEIHRCPTHRDFYKRMSSPWFEFAV